MEAVQRKNGTWYRTSRKQDQRPPYAQDWYSEYLHNFGLPKYFLRPGHLAMLHDDLEATRLRMHNAPSQQYAVIPRSNYLQLQYPDTPSWPSGDESGIYRLELQSASARAALSRHHPAISTTEIPYHVYVWPDGSLELRSIAQVEDLDPRIRVETDVAWKVFREGQRVPSSYSTEETDPQSASQPDLSREGLVQCHVDRHAAVNPMKDTPGEGTHGFLSELDANLAVDMGYVNAQGRPDPHQVNFARKRGDLALGIGSNAGPITIFQASFASANHTVASPTRNTLLPGAVSLADASSPPAPSVAADVTNANPGGPLDQTGGPRAEYATAKVGQGYVTIDRSRAKVREPEPHKLWCYSARGWRRWKRVENTQMNWGDHKMVADLNKHRQQTHQRSGLFSKKRAIPREDYKPEELEFVMDKIKTASGGRPTQPVHEIVAEFNQCFSLGPVRNETGIQSLIDRLRKEYKDYSGLKPRKPRGWSRMEDSKRLRGAGSAAVAHDDESEQCESDAEGEVDE
jgi:hypothetical protein